VFISNNSPSNSLIIFSSSPSSSAKQSSISFIDLQNSLKYFFPFILSLQLVQFSIISNVSSISFDNSVILTNEVSLLINSFNVLRDLFIDLSILLLLKNPLIDCLNLLTFILKFFVWKIKMSVTQIK